MLQSNMCLSKMDNKKSKILKIGVILLVLAVFLGLIVYFATAYDFNDLVVLGMVNAPIWATNHDSLENETWKYALVLTTSNSINYSDTLNVTINLTKEFNKLGFNGTLDMYSLRLYQVDAFGNCLNASGVTDDSNNTCYAIPLEMVDA